MTVKKEDIGFRKNIKKHGLIFHYNIRVDPMLGIGYVAVRRIRCIYYACLSKLSSAWNRIKHKFNQVQ